MLFHQEDPKVFSAMIWTVHFAYDNVGWPSFERAAQMINDTGMFMVPDLGVGPAPHLISLPPFPPPPPYTEVWINECIVFCWDLEM